MKGKRSLLTIITILIACFVLCAADFDDSCEYKVVLPDTPIYADTSFSDVIATIPQNAVVNVIGDPVMAGDKEWQKISYTTYTGYVLSSALYKSYANDSYTVTIAKVKSSAMGKDVALYPTHSPDIEPDGYVHDGEKITIIHDEIDYGEFLLIDYNGTSHFILAENVTTGLSYNQLIAVIIIAGVAGLVIIVSIALMAVRRRKILDD